MNAALFTHCCHFDMFRNAGRPRASKQCSETSESMYVSQTFEERLCSMAPCGSVLLCCAAFWAQGAEWLWKMAEEQGPRHSATKAVKAFMKLVQHGSTNPVSF
jgi:hypothetical protein